MNEPEVGIRHPKLNVHVHFQKHGRDSNRTDVLSLHSSQNVITLLILDCTAPSTQHSQRFLSVSLLSFEE